MTFLEAALDILKRERKPLTYKEIVQKAMERKLLTFVGRTPELTMQTQLLGAVKKAPGNPFVRVKTGVFGLLRYPEGAPEPEPQVAAASGSEASNERADRGAAAEGGAGADRGPAADRAAASDRGAGAEGGREGRGRRRRRGGRGRNRRDSGDANQRDESDTPATAAGGEEGESMQGQTDDEDATDRGLEPEVANLSAEARAAALAESGLLGGGNDDADADDDDDDDDGIDAAGAHGADAGDSDGDADVHGAEADEGADAGSSDDGDGAEEGDEDEGEGQGSVSAGEAAGGSAGPEGGLSRSGRRRRRRRRRGDGEPFAPRAGADASGVAGAAEAQEQAAPTGAEGVSSAPDVAPTAGPAAEGSAEPQQGRRVLSPVDAAIEVLRGQAPGRGMHVRQLADAAVRRRLVHGEPNEAWRVMRAALASEPKERLRAGTRPRLRPAGSGLFALARRPPDMDLERAEFVFGEARRALRERTAASLEQRLGELAPAAFEAVARILLQREGFGPATFVKRVEGTVYLEALRGRGARPSRCLIALRSGAAPAGRRAIGELRAGIRARGQDEGVLMLAARLAEDAIAEWRQPGPPLEVADGAAMAETCVRNGVGVVSATVNVDFVDADFFAELQEG